MAKTANHIALLLSPGMGHIIPLLEFSKQLVLHHNFHVTCLIPTSGPPPKAMHTLLQSLPQTITSIFLPPVNLSDLPLHQLVMQLLMTISRSLPSLQDALKSLNTETQLAAFVIDAFGIEALQISKELNIPSYIFWPASAMTLSFFFHWPKLDKAFSCEFKDLKEPLKLPGCIPIHGRDILDSAQNRTSEHYKISLRNANHFGLAEGIIVNTFNDLEAGALKALQEGTKETDFPPVYPIGPIIQTASSNINRVDQCMRWLEKQPDCSVIYVSFGSGGTLSYEQLNKLALGLEKSGQKFLWVVRKPNNEAANASYLSHDNGQEADPLGFLPEGFVERTKGQGFVVPSWAPQVQILAHRSTAGFVTHCGWSSTLESVIHGVPLIAWPLFAEQKMNAVLVVEDLRVALRPKASENEVIGCEEIARVVKDLVKGEEGKRVRKRMNDLKNAALKAHSEDGSSTKLLSDLAVKWKNHALESI